MRCNLVVYFQISHHSLSSIPWPFPLPICCLVVPPLLAPGVSAQQNVADMHLTVLYLLGGVPIRPLPFSFLLCLLPTLACIRGARGDSAWREGHTGRQRSSSLLLPFPEHLARQLSFLIATSCMPFIFVRHFIFAPLCYLTSGAAAVQPSRRFLVPSRLHFN